MGRSRKICGGYLCVKEFLMNKQKQYDVIILGGGIGGASLACVLSRHGYKVALLEKGSHPRFAIGEAVFFRTCLWIWLTGQRYDVPELLHIISPEAIAAHIAPSAGMKQSFGQAYHRVNESCRLEEAHNIVTPLAFFFRDTHFFRQDIDHYLVKTAVKYGTDYRDCTAVSGVEMGDTGVSVTSEAGETFHGRYLVDGAGYRSPLADQLGLRDETPRTRTNSRSIFSHFANVQPFDDTLDGKIPGAYSLFEGTLHHAFDGGWFWVIPFNNNEWSENPLCSVGVMLDRDKFPRPEGVSPQEEFWRIVNRYPSIAKHMQGANAVRPFVGTDRIQYSAQKAAGPRYTLLAHSYGFVDPLYSRGMMWTFENIYALGHRLMSALDDDDFAPERFEYLNGLAEAQLQQADQLVYNGYRAMAHFDTWNAWLRVFVAGELLPGLYLWRRALQYIATGDKAWLVGLDTAPKPCFEASFAAPYQALVNEADDLFGQMERNEITPETAAARLFARLQASDFLPHPGYAFGDPHTLHNDFTRASTLAKIILWGKFRAPKPMRQEIFDLPLGTLQKIEFEGRVLGPLRQKRQMRYNGRSSTFGAMILRGLRSP
jgi:tetracycline 7-halogenase / FADH2 O2-dependent halogenase